MRRVLALAVLATAAILALRDGDSRLAAGDAGARLASTPAGPLLGFVHDREGSGGTLRLFAPGTLRALDRGAVRLEGFQPDAWAVSPDERRVAVAVRGTRLKVIQRVPLRAHGGTVDIGSVEPPWAMAWVRAQALLALAPGRGSAPAAITEVDPIARRILAVHELSGTLVSLATGRRTIVALLGSFGRIGPARLAVATGDGAVREWPLPAVAVGQEGERYAIPAVALDETGRRAFVVAATSALRVVEIDLITGRATTHDLRRGGGPLAALRDLLDPVAHAKGADGTRRSARWLGDGRLAVSGERQSTAGGSFTIYALGLELVDVVGWRATFVDGWNQGDITAAAGRLLVGQRGELVAYDHDGRERYRRPKPQSAHPVPARGRLYLRHPGRGSIEVVDARTGATERVLPATKRLPRFLER